MLHKNQGLTTFEIIHLNMQKFIEKWFFVLRFLKKFNQTQKSEKFQF
jgi:hypothetical protein